MAHTYILGASGSGKSTLLKNRALQNIRAGHGVCFIDPHGDDIDELMAHIPRRRVKDTVLFDPTDDHYLIWNPLAHTANYPLTATSLTDAIKDAWGYHGMTTPVMEMYLYFTIATLIENNASFYTSLQLLTQFRLPVKDTTLRIFWDNFEAMTPKERREQTSSTLNKLFTLFADPRLRRLLSTSESRIDMADIVRDKIFLIRLPQGQLGLSKVSLLGSILLSLIHVACLSRTGPPFHIYVDEFHHFSHSTLAEMLSGLRKFNVHITLAHQFIAQLDRQLFGSLMGNCATRHVFRVSPEDARQFQECKKNGPICLHELETFSYRTFPWQNRDHDQKAVPLPTPQSPNMPKRIRNHTHQNYCRETQ